MNNNSNLFLGYRVTLKMFHDVTSRNCSFTLQYRDGQGRVEVSGGIVWMKMTSHREEIKWYPVDKGYSGEGNQIRKLLSINIRFKISRGAGLRIRMETDRICIRICRKKNLIRIRVISYNPYFYLNISS